jgi:hypothetical protein
MSAPFAVCWPGVLRITTEWLSHIDQQPIWLSYLVLLAMSFRLMGTVTLASGFRLLWLPHLGRIGLDSSSVAEGSLRPLLTSLFQPAPGSYQLRMLGVARLWSRAALVRRRVGGWRMATRSHLATTQP